MSGRPARDVTQLHVSYSQIHTYLICPEKFRQQYVASRPPSHRSGDLVFGSAVHGALARYHAHLMESGEKPPLDEVKREFDALWDIEQGDGAPVLWEDAETPDKLVERGHNLLALYHETHTPRRVLAVERSFTLPAGTLGGNQEEAIVGAVDLVEEDKDGTVYITELKTAGRRYDDIRLQHDLQLSVYAAARVALGFPDARLRFRVLLKTKRPGIETYDVRREEEQLAEMRTVVTQVLRAIDHGIYYPLRSWACAGCAFRSTCGK